MSIYLDNSVVVPFFLPDAFNARAEAFLLSGPAGLVLSDFVRTEFASVVGLRVRTKEIGRSEARAAFSNFDVWSKKRITAVQIDPIDIEVAEGWLRRLDLTLRAPDAINLAVAKRLGATLATFDNKMASCATTLGLPLIKI
ncbi:MAG TPA: type II toxin-antitoxin system VapC family toxin [Rhizomicrobium sp.]